MTDLYGSYFQFDGESSVSHNKLIFVNIETKRNRQVYGSIKSTTIFNKKNKTRYLIDDNYDDYPFSFEIEMVTEDGSTLDEESRRTIEKWLFNKRSYKRLYMYDCNENTGVYTLGDLYLNCRFINPERVEYNGGVVGYYATLEADSGSWWKDIEATFNNTNDDDSNGNQHYFTYQNVDAFPCSFIYPEIEVVMKDTIGEGGRTLDYLQITNNNDTIISSDPNINQYRTMRISDIGNGSTIIIKSETNHITKDGVTISYDDITSPNFPRLVNGNNVFSIKGGNAKIIFRYKQRRPIV